MKPDIVYYRIIKKSDVAIAPEFLSTEFCSQKLETIQAYQALSDLLREFKINFFDFKIYKTKNGKPFFKKRNPEIKIELPKFNYSHSKNYIAIALSKNKVGIDIEEWNHEINDAVAKKFLENEKDPKNRLKIWVKKEAYSKLIGKGIKAHFSELDFQKIKSSNEQIETPDFFCAVFADKKSNFISK